MPSTGCQGEGQEGQPRARPGWVQPTVLVGTHSPVLMSLSLFFRLTAPKIPEGEKVDFDVSLRELGSHRLPRPPAFGSRLSLRRGHHLEQPELGPPGSMHSCYDSFLHQRELIQE